MELELGLELFGVEVAAVGAEWVALGEVECGQTLQP